MFKILFQKFDVWPVLVRVDYSPRRVDLAALRGGNYVELVNLVPWKVILHSNICWFHGELKAILVCEWIFLSCFNGF